MRGKFSAVFFAFACVCATASAFNWKDMDKVLKQDCSQQSAPEISEQRKRAVIYQIAIRTFVKDGKIESARKLLPHLKELGVDYVYFCPLVEEDGDLLDEFPLVLKKKPVQMKYFKCPYRVKSYFKTDSEFGKDADVKAFVQDAHKLGMKVLFDLVYYHCGPNADFIKENPDFVRRDSDGKIKKGGWGWPELNFENPKLREYLLGNMRYFVKEFGADGFRTDAEWYVPADFWENSIRELRKIKPEIFMLAEAERPSAVLGGYDVSYSYSWQDILDDSFARRKGASAIEKSWKAQAELFPKGARIVRTRENHDTAQGYEDARPDKVWPNGAYDALIFLNFTIDGIPFIYNGNEIADGAKHVFSRYSPDDPNEGIDWSAAETPKGKARFVFMKKLVELRHTQPALSEGETLWLSNSAPEKVVSFERVCKAQRLVCVINARNEAVSVDVDLSAKEISASKLDRGAKWKLEEGKLKLELAPYGFALLEAR